ncbi:MAG: hypothetical protein B6229_01290 [Spirochaetaceae bacterium 4572_7]|nr:MAG: hypothetical protein B6229_01290 [Spirochaetaceae bacterium 4572_7]
MRKYLTIKKVLIDSVALYKSHFLYLTLFIGVVVMSNYFTEFKGEFSVIQALFMLLYFFLNILVEMISTELVASSYLYDEFVISNNIKQNIRRILPFTLFMVLGQLAVVLGFLVFIIPGVLALPLFYMIKIDYIVTKSDFKTSFRKILKLMGKKHLFEILKIMSIPALLIFLGAEFLYKEILNGNDNIQLLLTLVILLLKPIGVCFNTSIYFNLIKESELESTNQLV